MNENAQCDRTPANDRRSGALDRDPEIHQPKVAMVTMLGVVWVDPTTGESVDP